jgi:tRNA-guanine family transglycosylase
MALVSLHNIAFFVRLMEDARRAIMTGRFKEFHAEFIQSQTER